MIITGLKALIGGAVLGFFLGQAFTIGDAIKGGTELLDRVMVSFDRDFRRPALDQPPLVAGEDADDEVYDKAYDEALEEAQKNADAGYRAGTHRR